MTIINEQRNSPNPDMAAIGTRPEKKRITPYLTGPIAESKTINEEEKVIMRNIQIPILALALFFYPAPGQLLGAGAMSVRGLACPRFT